MANFKSSLFTFGRSAIGRALAISLALHAVLLLQKQPASRNEGPQRRVAPGGNSLEATLSGMPASLAVTPALPANPHAGTAPAPRLKPARTGSQSPRHSLPYLSSGSTKAFEIGPPEERSSGAGETPRFAGLAAASALPGEDGIDANGLRQYRLSLALESRRFKRYPQHALEQGWSGTAQVRVAIGAGGAPQSVQLLSSSGHDALDAVALEMIGKAALTTALPAGLRGRSFSVPLPVEFKSGSE